MPPTADQPFGGWVKIIPDRPARVFLQYATTSSAYPNTFFTFVVESPTEVNEFVVRRTTVNWMLRGAAAADVLVLTAQSRATRLTVWPNTDLVELPGDVLVKTTDVEVVDARAVPDLHAQILGRAGITNILLGLRGAETVFANVSSPVVRTNTHCNVTVQAGATAVVVVPRGAGASRLHVQPAGYAYVHVLATVSAEIATSAEAVFNVSGGTVHLFADTWVKAQLFISARSHEVVDASLLSHVVLDVDGAASVETLNVTLVAGAVVITAPGRQFGDNCWRRYNAAL